LPFKRAVPNFYVINKDVCLFFIKGVCRVCEKFCRGNAIIFDQKEEITELNMGAIVEIPNLKREGKILRLIRKEILNVQKS
jgi:heterodisulfide reductase subunit A-like polyferredoxin